MYYYVQDMCPGRKLLKATGQQTKLMELAEELAN